MPPGDYMKLGASRLNKMPKRKLAKVASWVLKRPSSCKSVKTVAFVKIQ